MANNFVDHKDRWLTIAKGEFDYSLFFIKSWLPFNAWYCNNYPTLNNKDSKILHEIKTDNNVFRARIVAHLEGTDIDSLAFRKHLVQLHQLLEKCVVPDVQNKISFQSILFRENSKRIFTVSSRNIDYKIELVAPVPPHNIRIKCVVLKKGLNILPYQNNKYDLAHLQSDAQFLSLSSASQSIIIDGFKQLDPSLKESLLVHKTKDSLLTIQSPLFIKDSNLLSKAIIEILYKLRCILFHGQIQPTKDNLEIYEPAYYMLRLLLKSLH